MTEKLDKICACRECKAVFLFKAHVKEHDKQTDHEKMNIISFGQLNGRVISIPCYPVNFEPLRKSILSTLECNSCHRSGIWQFYFALGALSALPKLF